MHNFIKIIVILCLCGFVPMKTCAQTGKNDAPQNEKGVPKIVFESQAHDFGTVKPKTALTHEFVFKNTGTATLLIEKIKAG